MKRIEESKKEVILFGYDKFGRHMYTQLSQSGYPVELATMQESNYQDAVDDNVKDIRYFNPKRNDSIKMLGIDPKKHLLYCAMDHTSSNLFLVLSLRELYHDAVIVVVSNSDENTRKLKYAGANTILEKKSASQIDFYSRRLILVAIIDKETGDDLIYINKGVDHKFDGGDTLVLAGRSNDILAFRRELSGS